MKIHAFCCAGLSFVLLLALTTSGNAALEESGTIDFDTDPGFSISDTGGPAPIVNVMTSMSVADITLNRDGGFERVFIPLANTYVGNGSRADMRIRFAILDSTTSADDMTIGAHSSTESNSEPAGDSSTSLWLEGGGDGFRHFAGGVANVDQPGSWDREKWFVYEFSYQAVPETSIWTLYEGDGTSLIFTTPGSTGGITQWDQVGFGNLDCCDNSSAFSVRVDWLTYAFNDIDGTTALPADPAYASDAKAPEPASVVMLALGAVAILLRRRRSGR